VIWFRGFSLTRTEIEIPVDNGKLRVHVAKPFQWRQNMKRRDFFKQAGIGSATLISLRGMAEALTMPESARSLMAPGEPPASPFVILLAGPYEPVVRCPDLGLLTVNPCDGSYSTTKIYPVSDQNEEQEANRGYQRGDRNREAEKAIGSFYVSIGGNKPVAYDLPGGAMAMVFTGDDVQRIPDGQGGTFIVGTFDLNITEATGIYESFVGGQNKMVDILHRLADGTFVEHCYCIISRL
jgi:hypothetical protein